MISALAINHPKLQPDDWDKWWYIWDKYAEPLKKVKTSPNAEAGLHVGFDVYRTNIFNPVYIAREIDLKSLYGSLYEQVMSLPFQYWGARFVMSMGDFAPHRDNAYENWAVRNMFYCADPDPQWYYTSLSNSNQKQFLTLPEETNWFAYNDGRIKHGTIYRPEFPKIIVQIFANTRLVNKYVESNFNEYPNHEISID
jgi:hypothetical protein